MRTIDLDRLMQALDSERDSLRRRASQYYESSEKYEMLVDFLDRLSSSFEYAAAQTTSSPSPPSSEGSMRGGEVEKEKQT